MTTATGFAPEVLETFHAQLGWARARCAAVARGTGRAPDAAEDLADDLLADVTERFLAAPAWFSGETASVAGRVRHRLALLVRQRATDLYRAEARARVGTWEVDPPDPVEAVDEMLARRTLVAGAVTWVRAALAGSPGRLAAVLAMDLPDALTHADLERAAPRRGADAALALLQGGDPERPGWKGLVAETLQGAGPIGHLAARDRARLVNTFEHKLARAYADIAAYLAASRIL